MKRLVLALAVVLMVTAPLLAQNEKPSGPHFNLNIIGVDNPKNSTLTDSNRHTIFVPLDKKGELPDTHIWLMPSDDFRVCDGNGFDEATDCMGNPITVTNLPGNQPGAVFELPCNTNLSGTTDVELVPCSVPEAQQLAYEVWARALGTPGGKAIMTTCAYDELGVEVCSTENVILERLNGKGNKPVFREVTNELTSIVADIDDDDKDERVSLFAGGLEDWFWAYDNNGLKLAQLRFYPLPIK